MSNIAMHRVRIVWFVLAIVLQRLDVLVIVIYGSIPEYRCDFVLFVKHHRYCELA